MIFCKHCGETNLVKNGNVKNKQRYLCKSCNRTFREGDIRQKYGMVEKLRVLKLYIEGVGIRAIERLEGISSPVIIHWIREFAKILKDKLVSTEIPSDPREISILEVDELFTYYQKKVKKPMCGLLWTETGIKLLIL